MSIATNYRPCVHPHKPRNGEGLSDIPLTPVAPRTLVLTTDIGETVVHGVAENERALEAQHRLGERFLDAGIAYEFTFEFSERGMEYGLPQWILSLALAEYEQRFCIADWLRYERIPRL